MHNQDSKSGKFECTPPWLEERKSAGNIRRLTQMLLPALKRKTTTTRLMKTGATRTATKCPRGPKGSGEKTDAAAVDKGFHENVTLAVPEAEWPLVGKEDEAEKDSELDGHVQHDYSGAVEAESTEERAAGKEARPKPLALSARLEALRIVYSMQRT